MRRILLILTLLPWMVTPAQATSEANAIAKLCQQGYPGQRGVQSYCIKQHRNYQEWLSYQRKRVYNDKSRLNHQDRCVAKHRPDYRAAFDCTSKGPGLLSLF